MKKITQKKNDKDSARQENKDLQITTEDNAKKQDAQCCAKISSVMVGCHD